MRKNLQWKGSLFLAVMAVTAVLPLAPKADASDSAAVTMTVTAVGSKNSPPPPVKKEDVELYRAKARTQVADWKGGVPLHLAILIDDSLESNVALQWNDLKAFMMAQPATTYIAVAYARNGTAMVAQDFTADHALAAKALRMPLGNSMAFTSPYLALLDWIKRWPDSNDRKSILLFSSGIDYFRGPYDPVDPDVDFTIEQAQKKNINIWSIYAPDAGHRARGNYVQFLAQGFLTRVAGESGAESFYIGFLPAVSFKPYFDELQQHLNNQYLLTFVGNAGKKGKFEGVRLATELPGVEFLAAPQAFVPAYK
ncbi:MAG: vWA domain-containing protein [Candidatus Acidiferrales bacterium]